jgi:hypothetical protein
MTTPASLSSVPDLDGRFDAYGKVHKALRRAQCEMLIRLGQADFDDVAATAPLLADLRVLLALGAGHVGHEETFVHAPIEARAPTATAHLDEQHGDHRRAFAELAAMVDAIEAAPGTRRPVLGRRLYLAWTQFLSHDLAHMHEEETMVQPLLWRLFTDGELHGIEAAIVGSLPPEKRMGFMRLMVPAINRRERAALLGAMKATAPAPAFDAVINFVVRPSLSAEEFADLAGRLGLAA